jgi:hypothetical protein
MRGFRGEMKMVQCGSGVAGVLGHELDQRSGPGLRASPNAVPPPVSLEGLDDHGPGNLESSVSLAKMAFVFLGICQAGTHEIAGTASNENPRYRLGIIVQRLEGLLLGGRGQVRMGAMRDHGPDFAQG